MKLNPYFIARTIRAILLVVFIFMLFGLPSLLIGADSATSFTFLSILAFIFIAICVASVFCTKYERFKPAPNKKAERMYGIIALTLFVLAFSFIFILPPIINSMR